MYGKMISAFVSPLPSWQPPVALRPVPSARRVTASPEDCQDHPAAQNAASPVVCILRAKPSRAPDRTGRKRTLLPGRTGLKSPKTRAIKNPSAAARPRVEANS
jgi:hypothetical protein